MSQTKAQLIDNLVQPITGALGSASAPTFSFTADPNTGLFSPGADQLSLSTGGTGRLFINSSGNIGINTSNQQRRLHVVGSDGAVASFPTIGPRDIVLIENNNNCNLNLIAGTGAASEFKFTVDGASTHAGSISYEHTSNILALRVNASERLRITSAGFVGVGTSTVDELLHLKGASTASTTLKVESTATASERSSIHFFNGSISRGRVGGSNDFDGLTLDSSTTESAAAIRFRTGGASLTTKMTLTSGGSLGIGTSSPGELLTVSNGSIRIEGSGAQEFVTFFNSSTGGRQWTLANAGATNIHGVSAGTLYFRDSTAGANRVAIDSSGRLGIGTTSPSNVLHIAATTPTIRLQATDGGRAMVSGADGNLTFEADPDSAVASSHIKFNVDDTERARIDSSGRLLVGTSSAGMGSTTTTTIIGGLLLQSTGLRSIASGGTLDLELAGTGNVGHLYVTSVLESNAGVRTNKTFFVTTRLGNATVITQLNTADGSSGGRTFTITNPSGNIYRYTDTSSNAGNLAVSIAFVGTMTS